MKKVMGVSLLLILTALCVMLLGLRSQEDLYPG